jgi:hypothetical protein
VLVVTAVVVSLLSVDHALAIEGEGFGVPPAHTDSEDGALGYFKRALPPGGSFSDQVATADAGLHRWRRRLLRSDWLRHCPQPGPGGLPSTGWALSVLIGNEAWSAAFFGRRSARDGFLGLLGFLVPLAGLQHSVMDVHRRGAP